jgi:hypothetical protein
MGNDADLSAPAGDATTARRERRFLMAKPEAAAPDNTQPTLQDLMAVFDIEDHGERLDRIRDTVLPYLREEMARAGRVADEIYGEGWREYVTASTFPSPSFPRGEAQPPLWGANAGFVPRRLRDRSYRKFTGQGKRAAILDVRSGVHMDEGSFAGFAWFRGRPEVRLFSEIWNGYRDECLAVLEGAAAEVWSDDAPCPGPPSFPLASQIDVILRGDPSHLGIQSGQGDRDWSGPSAATHARKGVVFLWPIAIGVIEAALDRQPSVRNLHQRLCKWVASLVGEDADDEAADEQARSRTRYLVLKRDGYRCVMCGATATEGAKLQVDHILPRSKGGKAVLDNLQTLCDRCNRGKGADISPDLRARASRC